MSLYCISVCACSATCCDVGTTIPSYFCAACSTIQFVFNCTLGTVVKARGAFEGGMPYRQFDLTVSWNLVVSCCSGCEFSHCPLPWERVAFA